MKGPTICRLPCGSARRTAKPSPRSRVRGTMMSSSASQVLGSPSTGSLEGSQLLGLLRCYFRRSYSTVVPAEAGTHSHGRSFCDGWSHSAPDNGDLWLWGPACAGTTTVLDSKPTASMVEQT